MADHCMNLMALTLTGDGKLLAALDNTSLERGIVRVWDVGTGAVLRDFTVPEWGSSSPAGTHADFRLRLDDGKGRVGDGSTPTGSRPGYAHSRHVAGDRMAALSPPTLTGPCALRSHPPTRGSWNRSATRMTA